MDKKKFKQARKRFKIVGTQAAPAYNTSDRLTRSCLEYLCKHYRTREAMLEADIAPEFLVNMICKKRHDYLKLEVALQIVDNHLGSDYLPVLKERLSQELSDEEILNLTLNSNQSTLKYIKETVPVDTLIGLIEGRALFEEKVGVEKFSRKIIAIFEEAYPLKKMIDAKAS